MSPPAGDSIRLRIGVAALFAIVSALTVAIMWMLLTPLTPAAVPPPHGRPPAAALRVPAATDAPPTATPTPSPTADAAPDVPSSPDDRLSLTVPGPPGEAPVAYLTIPSIGLSNVAIFDRGQDSSRRMLIAPGFSVTHYTLSGPLGGGGNAVLYGHDDIQGSVFARLSTLRNGDRITMRIAGGLTYHYVVQGNPAVVLPSSVRILNGTDDGRLTLFTCFPDFVDTRRVVVVALPTL